MAELLEDVVGVNKAGLVCHPYKLTRGQKTGQYSYTLETDSNLDYVGIDEAGLRALIESGAFNGRGGFACFPLAVRLVQLVMLYRFAGTRENQCRSAESQALAL
ncbi:hypothetical protein KIH13_19570 [Pseudomonas viridiflava]|nr:hypothetical protein KIH13_19570 [Pseudomonas viridiflava]